MPKRDTYNDYLTGLEEVMDEGALGKMLRRLAKRSGFWNTNAGVLNRTYMLNQDVLCVSVTFDSKAWTGR